MAQQRSASDPWAVATWEGAAEESLAAGAKLTLPERLLWLEGDRTLGELPPDREAWSCRRRLEQTQAARPLRMGERDKACDTIR